MIELSISMSGFYHLDLCGCLRKARQLGYGGVEAAYYDLFSFDRGPNQRFVSEHLMRNDEVTDRILAAQAEMATRVTGVHGPVVPLNAPNWKDRLWIYKEAFRRMARLGARDFTVHAGGGTVADFAAEFPAIERNIAELAVIAESYGIAVCVESGCMPYEINTISDLAALLKRNPRLSHTADLSHNYFHAPKKDDPYCIDEVIEKLGDRVRVVHAVDHQPSSPWCHDLPVGMGNIDWKRFFKGILAKGFNGTICCENSPDAITAFLRKLRRICHGATAVLPPSTVGAHTDLKPEDALANENINDILGHDPYMRRVPFDGATIIWSDAKEQWDGTTIGDQLYSASLEYIKSLLSQLGATFNPKN